jgi:hypothetical protein
LTVDRRVRSFALNAFASSLIQWLAIQQGIWFFHHIAVVDFVDGPALFAEQ